MSGARFSPGLFFVFAPGISEHFRVLSVVPKDSSPIKKYSKKSCHRGLTKAFFFFIRLIS
ncbi:hypothetical protein BOX30_05640 [Leptospirillum ferriphilum]|nr:hypothetical protein BOX30_05640 [Leptospirillum ferriphilum]